MRNNMSEPLDIDKIEEELKQISPWPWRFKDDDFQGSGDIFPNFVSSRPICNITAGWVTRVDLGNGISNGVDAPNGPFIASAPERIAALVKRVRELERYKLVHEYVLNNFGIYPQSVSGTNEDYEKRTEFMEGWNAAIKQVVRDIIEAYKLTDEELKRGSDEV